DRNRSCSPVSRRSRGRIAPPPNHSQARESRIKFARNPLPNARFPANSITQMSRFQIPYQSLGNSSPTTIDLPSDGGVNLGRLSTTLYPDVDFGNRDEFLNNLEEAPAGSS